jgi:hypothetical protein
MRKPVLIFRTLTYLSYFVYTVSISVFGLELFTDFFLELPFMATRLLPTRAQTFVSLCLQNIQFCIRFFSSFVYSSLQKTPMLYIVQLVFVVFSPQSFVPEKTEVCLYFSLLYCFYLCFVPSFCVFYRY